MRTFGIARPAGTTWLSVVVVGALAAAWFGWSLSLGSLPGWFSDAGSYLFLSDHFRGGSVAPDFAANLWRVSRFPPGFPLAIAAAGGGTQDPGPALALTTALSVAAVTAWGAWLARRLGVAIAALALGLAFLLSPALFVLQLDVVSEPLFMLLLAIALLAAEPATDGRRTWLREVLLLLALAALPFVRAAGVVILVAHAAWRCIATRAAWPDRVALAVLPAAPALAWSVYRAALHQPESYAASFDDDPSGVLAQGYLQFLSAQPARIVEATAGLFSFSVAWPVLAVAILLLLAAIVGGVLGMHRRQLAPFAFLAYLATVVAWPYPAEATRLLLVALPLLLCLAAEALATVVRRQATLVAALVVAAAALALELPAVARILARGTNPVATELRAYRGVPSFWRIDDAGLVASVLDVHASIDGALRELRDAVPAGECVYSTVPMLVELRSGVAAQALPLDLASAADARTRLDRCRYVLMVYMTTPQHRQAYMYPQELVRDWTDPVFVSKFDRQGAPTLSAVLVKTRADAARAP